MKRQGWLLCLPALFAASVQAADPAPAQPAAQQAPAQAPAKAQAPGWQPAPENVSAWADRCTDFTVNSWGFKDPKNTIQLIGMFSDPAIFLEFAQRTLNPESYARIAGTLLDPATASNYLEWTDPVIYTRWSAALMDPNFYTQAMQPMLDPATYMRWASASMDPRWWGVGVQAMNPGTWMNWAMAPLNPKVMAPVMKAADLNNTLKWSQAMADPANYRFLNVLSGALPGQAAPAGTSLFNPSSLFQMSSLPPTAAGQVSAPSPAR